MGIPPVAIGIRMCIRHRVFLHDVGYIDRKLEDYSADGQFRG